MRRAQAGGPADLRGLRWHLQPAEQSLMAQVERAALALARLQQQSQALEQAERRRSGQQQAQQLLALQSAQRDVLAGARAMRYLAGLETERIAAAAVRAELQQQVEAARETCAQRQRQLESVQALRSAAEREHAQSVLRRAWREADVAWLAATQLRRATHARQAGEAP